NFEKLAIPLICLVIFIYCITRVSNEFVFTAWDEFSFWAPSIKFIYTNNSLYTQESTLIFKSYPPIQQLFQYYVLNIFGWSEKTILQCQIFFILSCLLSATCGFFKKNNINTLILFLFSIALLYFFHYEISSIYVDPLLASLFAAALSVALKEIKINNFIFLLFLLSALTLTKQIGLLLSLSVMAVYFVNILISSECKILSLKTISSIFLLIVSIGLSYKSWSFYLKSIGENTKISVDINNGELYSIFYPRLHKTLVNFVSRINDGWYVYANTEWLTFSLIELNFLFLAFAVILLMMSASRDSIKLSLSILTLFIGCILYNLFLLFCYIFIFSEFEGIQLASFFRYSSTYAYAVLLICIISLTYILNKFKNKITQYAFSGILVFCLIYSPGKFFLDLTKIDGDRDVTSLRENVNSLYEIAASDSKKQFSAYFISQNSTGLEKYIFNYISQPNESQWWCWSIGDKYNESDVWTCDVDIASQISNYDYLVIYNADDKFWEIAHKYLENQNEKSKQGVYKI
ncbi:TPA: hypothetical protein ON571_003545, partial [Morganella morganii]|nr:hypothetical protein [Morganella morganii]